MTSKYFVNLKNEEEYSSEFLAHLDALNRIVAGEGGRLEGNLCYLHKDDKFVGAPPDPRRAPKRRNFSRILKHKNHFLEVGFNAGHSALLALSSNPDLQYFAADIGTNLYSKKCAAYLASAFPGRFDIVFGDSREVLPYLALHKPRRFDCLHVDGGHSEGVCRADISNCLRLAADGAHLILDDTKGVLITDIYIEFVARGYLITENLGYSWEGRENLLARIVKLI